MLALFRARQKRQPLVTMRGRGGLIPPNPCITFTYRARSKIFASIFSFLISSHLARSARSGAFHSLLCRRSGTSLIYCFNMERRVLLSSGMPPSHRVIVVDTFSIYCLMCATRPVRKWSAGGPNFHIPYAAQRVQLGTYRACAPSGAF